MHNTNFLSNLFRFSEKRLCFRFETPFQGEQSQENQDQNESTDKPSFSVHGRAQEQMDKNGIHLDDGILTFEKNPEIRMRFDEKTKEVSLSANRGKLLIGVRNFDGTGITYETVDGSFIQAVNQRNLPKYVTEGMNRILTPKFEYYAMSGDIGMQRALEELGISFTSKGVEYGSIFKRMRINLTTPPPQHVEVGSDGKDGITLKVYYTPEDKEKGEKDLLLTISKDGKVQKEELKDSGKLTVEDFWVEPHVQLQNGDIIISDPSVRGPDTVYRLDNVTNTYKMVNYGDRNQKGISENRMRDLIKKFRSMTVGN